MLLGRFLPIVFVLALAGSLARQKPVPASEGTLPTHRLLFGNALYRNDGGGKFTEVSDAAGKPERFGVLDAATAIAPTGAI